MNISNIHSIIWLFTLSLAANGAVIGTDHMSSSGNWFSLDQEYASSDGSGFRDQTGFIFTATGASSFHYDGSLLDEGASVFFVNPGDEFSEANILGGAFTQLTFGSVYTPPAIFFLGIRTPALGVGDFGTFTPAYAWAEIQNFGTGELVLVDHAVAYSSQGIIVNTLTSVPEPSTLSTLALSLVMLARRRRLR